MRREVFIGVLILGATLVGSRGTLYPKNSPAEVAQPPNSLDLIPPTLNQLRAVMFEIGGYVIPEKLGVRSSQVLISLIK